MSDFTRFDASDLQVTIEAPLLGKGVEAKAIGLSEPKANSTAPSVDVSARILPTTTPGGR